MGSKDDIRSRLEPRLEHGGDSTRGGAVRPFPNLRRQMTAPATFSLFVGNLPPNRGFLVAAGVQGRGGTSGGGSTAIWGWTTNETARFAGTKWHPSHGTSTRAAPDSILPRPLDLTSAY